MSGLPALSIELPAVDATDYPQRGPRVADAIDAPVMSPVHELQDQLLRLNAAESDIEGQLHSAKVPGWLRVTVPFGMSVLLWSGIFWASGALQAFGFTE